MFLRLQDAPHGDFIGADGLLARPQLIFCNEYTQAEGQNWHLKHFCCFECDCVLAGEMYVMEKDKPVCEPCYMRNYAVVRIFSQITAKWLPFSVFQFAIHPFSTAP